MDNRFFSNHSFHWDRRQSSVPSPEGIRLIGRKLHKGCKLCVPGWTHFGEPTVVTSDQGPQFAGQWFKTMCARLGIKEAFSQAYNPQANRRAEVAGKQLIGCVRKIHAEEEVNWVEALPRALRYIHERVGACGISPYKLLMGRKRPLAGLPYTPEQDCLEAHDYFNHLEELDSMVADQLDGNHLVVQRRHNAGIKKQPAFYVGDRVFIMKPKPVGGHKIQTYWIINYLLLFKS
jgi:hypothetical protein